LSITDFPAWAEAAVDFFGMKFCVTVIRNRFSGAELALSSWLEASRHAKKSSKPVASLS
jgi:hypothetical protein